jgi:DNA-binding winged helix-turn-helix (wHTH) protein/tetratricopeptide (TPR) repeat protein
VAARTYRFGEFELSEARFELRRAGVGVPVQPKAMNLLLYLLRHRERVVTKEELLSTLWPGIAVTEASLSKAVGGARRALVDGAEEQRHIRTVRGRGFRFVAPVDEHAADPTGVIADRPRDEFVGRTNVQAAIERALAAARAGTGCLVLLAGEAGMGKTRTAEEVARHARVAGMDVLVGWCPEADGAPDLWPWAQVLRQLAADGDPSAIVDGLGDGLADLTTLVPALARGAATPAARSPLGPEQARFRLLDTIAEVLRRAARRRPLLIVLDDCHRADRTSLALLGFLSHELPRAGRLAVLATHRADDLADGHPLVDLARRPASLGLWLEGLARDEVARLAALETGGPVDERTAAAIHEASEGNPFFVKELARALATRDPPAPGAPMPLPAAVRDVLRERLARLPAACRDVLVPAALIDREIDVGLVARVTGVAAARVLELLDAARGAVVAEPPGMFRFAHALVRDALLEPLGAGERARLHRQIGEALETHYGVDLEPHLGRLAHHFAAAAASGGAARAMDYARRAGAAAARRLAYDEAAVHYRRALDLAAVVDAADARRRCEILLALGEAQIASGEPGEGRRTLRRAVEAARDLGSPEHLGRAALAAGGLLFSPEVGVQDPELVAWLEEALRGLPLDAGTLRVLLLARLTVALAWGHEWERGGELANEAVEAARREKDTQALGYALYVRRWTRLLPGELEAKLADSGTMVELAAASGLRELDLAARSCRFLDLVELGRLVEADRELALYEQLVAEARVPRYRWRARFYRAMRLLLEGRFAEAETRIFEAFTEEQRFASGDAGQVFGAQLGMLRWEQGRVAEMEPVLRGTIDRFPTLWFLRAMLALVDAETGRREEARDGLVALGVREVAALPKGLNWLWGLATLVEVSATLGDAEHAPALYALLHPCAPRLVLGGAGVTCWGALDRSLGFLAAAMGDWEAAERHFAAALATNTRIGARPWVGWTEYGWAAMLGGRDRPGDRAAARQRLGRASAIAEALGMARLRQRVAELAAALS